MTHTSPDPIAEIEAPLAGQALVLNLLGKLIFEYPQLAWLQSLADENVFDEIPFGDSQPDVQAGLSLLCQWGLENANGRLAARFDDLRADYTRLFVGPGPLVAAPWESVQMSEERLIFQEETLQVRHWYHNFGLEVVRLHQEPDDHAGLELAFLAHLTQQALSALAAGQPARLAGLLESRKCFLAEHPQRWVPGWCELVAARARTPFYQGVALVTRGVLAELAANAAANPPSRLIHVLG